MTLASDLEVVANAWVVVLSATLLVLSLTAYARSRRTAMLGLSIAFAFFLVKGLLATLLLFNPLPLPSLPLTLVVLDTAILVALYLATLRPR